MKKYFSNNKNLATLILSAALFCQCSFAQIGTIGASKVMGATVGSKITEADLAELKATTTVVILQNKEKSKLAEYKKAAEQVWNFNKIEFVVEGEINKYAGKSGYSFFMQSNVTASGGGYASIAYFMNLVTFVEGKKGKTESKSYAVFTLYADISKAYALKKSDNPEENEVFLNMSPGFIKCYLSVINTCLKENKVMNVDDESEDNQLLKELATDTLFIPDYITIGVGTKGGSTHNVADLLEKYEFKYKVMTSNELSTKILNSSKPMFVLSYVYYGNRKIVTIIEPKSGKIVFSMTAQLAMSGLNSGDFKDISKKIKKAAGK